MSKEGLAELEALVVGIDGDGMHLIRYGDWARADEIMDTLIAAGAAPPWVYEDRIVALLGQLDDARAARDFATAVGLAREVVVLGDAYLALGPAQGHAEEEQP